MRALLVALLALTACDPATPAKPCPAPSISPPSVVFQGVRMRVEAAE